MKCVETGIEGLVVVEPQVFGDERGQFFEAYNKEKFTQIGIHDQFLQDNQGESRAGVLRGLHFQLPPKTQAKLIRCIKGWLWDVAVDLRKTSPTYKKWFGLELSEENKKMLYIPQGFAHGYYALTDCVMLYKVSGGLWDKTLEGGVRWDDPEINIAWPIEGEAIINERDRSFATLSEQPLPF